MIAIADITSFTKT